jgi:hypothetical protein
VSIFVKLVWVLERLACVPARGETVLPVWLSQRTGAQSHLRRINACNDNLDHPGDSHLAHTPHASQISQENTGCLNCSGLFRVCLWTRIYSSISLPAVVPSSCVHSYPIAKCHRKDCTSSRRRQDVVERLQSIQLPVPAELCPTVPSIPNRARHEQCRPSTTPIPTTCHYAGKRFHGVPRSAAW